MREGWWKGWRGCCLKAAAAPVKSALLGGGIGGAGNHVWLYTWVVMSLVLVVAVVWLFVCFFCVVVLILVFC